MRSCSDKKNVETQRGREEKRGGAEAQRREIFIDPIEIYEVYTEEDGGTETQRRERKKKERDANQSADRLICTSQINRRTG